MVFDEKPLLRPRCRPYLHFMESLEKSLQAVLSQLTLPDGKTLLNSNIYQGHAVHDNRIFVSLQAGTLDVAELDTLQRRLTKKLQALPQKPAVLISLTAEKKTAAPKQSQLQDVKRIVAIASGKGGVGKSTTAACLGLAFTQAGYRVGLLDADIYGPSLPVLFNIHAPPEQNEEGKIRPHERYGVKIASIGTMMNKEAPLIWRGPMIDKALRQFIDDVEWGGLDLLLIDMPPGTGDAQLSLTRLLNMDGAVIVTTPQEVALLDARKAIKLFHKTGVPVFGIIENMSRFICPCCGKGHDLFAHGGGKEEAGKQNLVFLGEVPFSEDLGALAEGGEMPAKKSFPAYQKIAQQLAQALALDASDAVIAET